MDKQTLSIASDLLQTQKELFASSNETIFTIPEITTQELVSMFAENEKEARELAKETIKTIFGLQDGDIVFFRDSKIIIKRIKVQAEVIHTENITKPFAAVNTIQNNCIIFSAIEILAETEFKGEPLTATLKEFIKNKLRDEVALKPKDVIVFMGDKVVVRRFIEQGEQCKEKFEQRYNGLPKEEVEIIRKKTFQSAESEMLVVTQAMDECTANELNFATISFSFYEKNYIKIIQKYLTKHLNEYAYEDEGVIIGLGNMILREHWMFVHKFMANKLLDLLSKKDFNADRFLKSYSGDIAFESDNIKYRLPEIIDENGKKWNNVSIFSLIMQYKKSQESIEQKRQASLAILNKNGEVEAEISKLTDEATSLETVSESIEKEIVNYIDEEKKTNDELKELRTRFKNITNATERAKLQDEISARMIMTKKLSIRQEEASSRKKRNESQAKLISSKIDKLKLDIAQNIKKQKEEEEKVNSFIATLADMNKKFEITLKALALALMKKKTPIDKGDR